MHEVHCRNGTLVISEDPDDGDRIIVEPAINAFSPVRGTLHCVCGGTTGAVERALHCRRLSRIVLPSLSSRTRRHWAWPEHIPLEVVSMLARQHIILNVAQCRDALDLLCSLPDACTPLVFFDPQHRSVLDQLKFGNEGARRRGRAQLPAMTEDDIDAISIEIARVRPSGYLMRWMDTHNLCEAHHLRVRDHLQPVDLIAWDSLHIGMGKRSRRRGDYLIVLQKAPVKAGTTWRDHGIPSRWPERVDRKLHPHVKPIGLITRLIAATAEIGDLVCDPAAGSFITLHAAHPLGRGFIGCDLAYSNRRQHVIRAIVNEFPAPAGKAASAGTNADKYPSETGRQNMSDESKKLQADFASGTALTPARNQNIVDLDGFNDFTNEVEGAEDERVNTSARVIQGTKLKYIDPRWQIDGRDVTGMLLTLVGTRNVVNKWGPDGKPLVTNILPPGEKFPDFKKLNAEEPQSAWRMVFGKLQGPWQGQHCLYFIDDNYNPFTWPSPITTIGSSIAVEEIVDHIKRVRRYRDPDACVLVELSRKHFPNKYKPDRERPFLQVKQLVKLAPGRMSQLPEADEPLPALSQQGAPADAQTVEPITLAEEMNDTIKY